MQFSAKCYEKLSMQYTMHDSEVTSPNSSITNTLIPVLSIFFVMPFFLGLAYKYSLFVFNKRLQRQYLRKKYK
ncbi:hypothetical protein YYG_01648 [Plasmodium vinckei petteri]|uniref:PIR protein CIR protein n=1 Tax=Plasmodium vinckei petteri TaxID=138298 RepID=W7ALH1_PLAVN|nr:hypothetical protein YYG_01648 [Plasmodium vinckei petteri]